MAGSGRDFYAEAMAKHPHATELCAQRFDPFPRKGKTAWDPQVAQQTGAKIWQMYLEGLPFYNRDAIQSLEQQIEAMATVKAANDVYMDKEQYYVGGLDAEAHTIELPAGLVADPITGVIVKFLKPIVRFSTIGALTLPCAKIWDSRKAYLPTHIGTWAVRDDIPPSVPVLPCSPRELVAGYERHNVARVSAELQGLRVAILASAEWAAMRAAMARLGAAPNPVRKVVVFIDNDLMRANSAWTAADLRLLAFAQALAGPAAAPVWVSESTTETPLPRDAEARALLAAEGVGVAASDARLLLDVDEHTAVVEGRISETPVRQVIADFAVPVEGREPWAGPAVWVRPAMEPSEKDFEMKPKGPFESPEIVDWGNIDSPRSRALLDGYEEVAIHDPQQVLGKTVVYLRRGVAFKPWPKLLGGLGGEGDVGDWEGFDFGLDSP